MAQWTECWPSMQETLGFIPTAYTKYGGTLLSSRPLGVRRNRSSRPVWVTWVPVWPSGSEGFGWLWQPEPHIREKWLSVPSLLFLNCKKSV